MDFFQTPARGSFVFHQAGNSFVDSSPTAVERRQKTLTNPANRSERSLNLRALVFSVTAVSGLHLFGFKCFFYPDEPKQAQPKPLVMEVSTISLPVTTPPVVPIRAPLPPDATPPRKKIQPKPKLKKFSPLLPGTDSARVDQVLQQQPLENNPASQFANADPKRDIQTETQAYTEAHLDAAYDKNPKPDYPGLAISRGWQGKVLLRVQINDAGKVESAAVEQGSGHELLDESALEAVRQWLFVPAMQANTPIASSALVPIIFALQD